MAMVVALVLLLVLLGFPVGMGMAGIAGQGDCPQCDGARLGALAWCCAAILALLLVFASGSAATSLTEQVGRVRRPSLGTLERPPRSS
jgi:hypothetical protein